MLLKVGVDVDFEDGCEIFLIVVCKEGYLSIVSILLKVGVNINFEVFVYFLLIIVYNCGYLRIFIELIR